MMQCGPAPLAAIRAGYVEGHGYDAKFIFSEVNGDVVDWEVEDGVVTKPLHRHRSHVGQALWSARADNPQYFENVMHQYKPEEGSAEAQETYDNAKSGGVYDERDEDIPDAKDGPLRVKIHKDTFDDGLGQDMTFTFTVESEPGRNFGYYWHVEKLENLDRGDVREGSLIAKFEGQQTPDHDSTLIECVVPVSDYFPHLKGKNLGFKLSCVAAYLSEEGKAESSPVHSNANFTLFIPDDMIAVTGLVGNEGHYTVEGVFKNTAGFELTNVVALVEPEVADARSVELGDVAAGAETPFAIDVHFVKPGLRRFNVTIDTDEVPDIIKNYNVEIEPENITGGW